MSNSRFRWWQYAIKMVRDFPALNAACDLSTNDQRDRDAVAEAIRATMQQPKGEQRLLLIRLSYWDEHKQTVKEAAAQLSITETVAERWHGDFVREVGKCWGFDITKPMKKRGPRPKERKADPEEP